MGPGLLVITAFALVLKARGGPQPISTASTSLWFSSSSPFLSSSSFSGSTLSSPVSPDVLSAGPDTSGPRTDRAAPTREWRAAPSARLNAAVRRGDITAVRELIYGLAGASSRSGGVDSGAVGGSGVGASNYRGWSGYHRPRRLVRDLTLSLSRASRWLCGRHWRASGEAASSADYGQYSSEASDLGVAASAALRAARRELTLLEQPAGPHRRTPLAEVRRRHTRVDHTRVTHESSS